MSREDNLYFDRIFTQTLAADWLNKNEIIFDVLRLDTIHPVISGNKWFKLKYYLQAAQDKGFSSIATFGGAWSNHLIATAYACKLYGLKCMGIIRGEEPKKLSFTLQKAKGYGMELFFVSRSQYKEPQKIQESFNNLYWIPEGGYGMAGVEGASEILSFVRLVEKYSHIICAVGTGTMMTGLIKAINHPQQVIGISTMKGNFSLHEKITELLNEEERKKSFHIEHNFNFGGYGKYNDGLIQFIKETWYQHNFPTDIVYTSKTFFAAKQLIINHTIPKGSNVLMIHSGGLQGNLSLPHNTLPF